MSGERDPICVYKPGKDDKCDISGLEKLLTPDILNHKLVVISVAGRFRQGKSFLMNFIIKYLKANGEPGWLKSGYDEALKGFEWRHTRHAVTKGILIWPEIFKLRSASNEEIVVLLMDTQGVFDTNTTVKHSTCIFSLSVLLSSIQIFNLKQNIQGDDLTNLELFVELGRIASSENVSEVPDDASKPFQDMIFLVRDWPYPDETPYGWDGGQEVLDEELEKSFIGGELESSRASIRNSFESAKCFLMPHPGEKVDASSTFSGQVSDIKDVMVEHLKSFIESLLKPSNLKPKRIHGREITVREFLVFVEQYTDIMESDIIPTPETLYAATVRATNSVIVNECIEMYRKRLSAEIQENPQDASGFEELLKTVYSDVIDHFEESKKIGDRKGILAALKDLKAGISASKESFRHINSAAYEKKQYEIRCREAQLEQERIKAKIEAVGERNEMLEVRVRVLGEQRAVLQERARAAEERLKKLEQKDCSIS